MQNTDLLEEHRYTYFHLNVVFLMLFTELLSCDFTQKLVFSLDNFHWHLWHVDMWHVGACRSQLYSLLTVQTY